ncbi:MAG: twin-arginine translocation signal domain-containing protein [bacterium]|nr:MAG: twin-arginine translocation signal domain-containing protein [bacterium]
MTRRQFLAASGAAAVVLALAPLAGCGGGSSRKSEAQGLFVYRLSSRGKRASRASRKHNANMLFATWEAADANRAHPGDRSRIVRVNISPLRYRQLFTLPGSTVTDLRHV